MREMENNCIQCDYCRHCSLGEYHEVIHCDKCYGEVEEEEVREWEGQELCEDCYKALFLEANKDKLTADNALNIGERFTEAVEINGYLAWYFSTDQIEQLLINELNEVFKPSELIEYLGDDYESIIPEKSFEEMLAEWRERTKKK